MEDLRVDGRVVIPGSELMWRFDTSGGPGGQHANRSATRVELTFDLGSSAAFDDAAKRRISDRLGKRARNGVIVVTVDETRSQYRNRVVARQRLAELLRDAMRRPRTRRSTVPSRAARQRRLDEKRRRSETKAMRRKPDVD